MDTEKLLLHALNGEVGGYETVCCTALLDSIAHSGEASKGLEVQYVGTDQLILSMMTICGESFRALAARIGMSVDKTLQLREEYIGAMQRTPSAVILPTRAATNGMLIAATRAKTGNRRIEARDFLYGILKEGKDRGILPSQLGISVDADIESL